MENLNQNLLKHMLHIYSKLIDQLHMCMAFLDLFFLQKIGKEGIMGLKKSHLLFLLKIVLDYHLKITKD